MVAARGTTRSSSAAVGVLNILGGYFVIFAMFLLLSLLILHAISLVWSIPTPWGGIAALVIAFFVTAFGAVQANYFDVNETTIPLRNLNKEITVMLISDVHIGHHHGRARLEEIVERTNQRKPDIVCITGDLIDTEVALQPGVLDPLSRFAMPVYYVGGNHEKYLGADRVFEAIARQGVRILHNEVIETHGIQLVGIPYMKADNETFDMHPSDDPRTVQSVLGELTLRKDMPSVLLQHAPVGLAYAAAAGVDLMLSGHTHGGQVFPATLVAALAYPVSRGLAMQDKMTVFVSRGAGTFIARVRLGSSGEINLLQLTPAK
jgi:predicted MPP superfamily phosphohydrolase